MGNCGSSSSNAAAVADPRYAHGSHATSDDGTRLSKALDKAIREEERKAQRDVKILLLGPGSSGKSTVLKQMKIVHLNGFTKYEVEDYRLQIYRSVHESMRTVLELIDDSGEELEPETRNECASFVANALYPLRELAEGEPYPRAHLMPLKQLWADRQVQLTVSSSEALSLVESMDYFFKELDRLFAPDFIPTNDDILRCRHKTTGITETCFPTATYNYRMFDVGGQRSERRKWIHCFENVTAVLFLVALPGYDQCLIEDRESNQMQEALMLFDSICNSRWFARKTAFILFLNKLDLFKERILVSPIVTYFDDYVGEDGDFQASKEFFRDKFVGLNRSSKKEIYTHFTTALDTKLMSVVMTSVYDQIMSSNLAALAL